MVYALGSIGGLLELTGPGVVTGVGVELGVFLVEMSSFVFGLTSLPFSSRAPPNVAHLRMV